MVAVGVRDVVQVLRQDYRRQEEVADGQVADQHIRWVPQFRRGRHHDNHRYITHNRQQQDQPDDNDEEQLSFRQAHLLAAGRLVLDCDPWGSSLKE